MLNVSEGVLLVCQAFTNRQKALRTTHDPKRNSHFIVGGPEFLAHV